MNRTTYYPHDGEPYVVVYEDKPATAGSEQGPCLLVRMEHAERAPDARVTCRECRDWADPHNCPHATESDPMSMWTWQGRRTLALPVSTPPIPAPDWDVAGRACWGGYCGEHTQLWWVEPNVSVAQDHPSYHELEIGTVELEVLSGGLDVLSGGGQGLLMSPDDARTLAARLLAVAAVAEAGAAAYDAQHNTDQEDETR